MWTKPVHTSFFFFTFLFSEKRPGVHTLHNDTILEMTSSYPQALLFHNSTAKIKASLVPDLSLGHEGLGINFHSLSCVCVSCHQGTCSRQRWKSNQSLKKIWEEEQRMPLHTTLESWGLKWRAHKWTSPWPRGKRVSPRTLECQMGEPVCHQALSLPCSQDDLRRVP